MQNQKKCAKIEIYCLEQNKECSQIVEFLTKRGATYEIVNTNANIENNAKNPIVIVDGMKIGGLDDLESLDLDGKLNEVLFFNT